MTLLVTAFAAVISFIRWYRKAPQDEWKISFLCWMYTGASLMWLVDAVVEYLSVGAAYFTPAPADLLNDLFLGLSVILLGLCIWAILLLIRDPRGVIRKRNGRGGKEE